MERQLTKLRKELDEITSNTGAHGVRRKHGKGSTFLSQELRRGIAFTNPSK